MLYRQLVTSSIFFPLHFFMLSLLFEFVYETLSLSFSLPLSLFPSPCFLSLSLAVFTALLRRSLTLHFVGDPLHFVGEIDLGGGDLEGDLE